MFFSVSNDNRALTLSGHIVDKITRVRGALEQDYYETPQPGSGLLAANLLLQKSSDVIKEWEDIFGVRQNRPYPHASADTAWDVYWKTLHAGCYPDGMDADKTKESFEKWYTPFRHMQELSETSVAVDEIGKSDSGTPARVVAGVGWFGKVMYKSVKLSVGMVRNRAVAQSDIRAVHRTMFKTDMGYIGLSSRKIKDGDCVALFQGGKMPFGIRGKEGEFNIIGDAYVHGIIDGEAFDLAKCEAFEVY